MFFLSSFQRMHEMARVAHFTCSVRKGLLYIRYLQYNIYKTMLPTKSLLILEEVGDRTMVTLSRSYHGGVTLGVMADQRKALADTTGKYTCKGDALK